MQAVWFKFLKRILRNDLSKNLTVNLKVLGCSVVIEEIDFFLFFCITICGNSPILATVPPKINGSDEQFATVSSV